MALGHKGWEAGDRKKHPRVLRKTQIEFWLCHLLDMGRFDTGRVPSQGLSFREVHGVCAGVRSWGDCWPGSP